MSEIRRIHGRAIERAYQTGQDVSVCTHHGEESYYVRCETPKDPDKKPKDCPDSTTRGEDGKQN